MKYYKQRNVNEVFEYDVIKSLKKIESLISEKKRILSAVYLAHYLQTLLLRL